MDALGRFVPTIVRKQTPYAPPFYRSGETQCWHRVGIVPQPRPGSPGLSAAPAPGPPAGVTLPGLGAVVGRRKIWEPRPPGGAPTLHARQYGRLSVRHRT